MSYADNDFGFDDEGSGTNSQTAVDLSSQSYIDSQDELLKTVNTVTFPRRKRLNFYTSYDSPLTKAGYRQPTATLEKYRRFRRRIDNSRRDEPKPKEKVKKKEKGKPSASKNLNQKVDGSAEAVSPTKVAINDKNSGPHLIRIPLLFNNVQREDKENDHSRNTHTYVSNDDEFERQFNFNLSDDTQDYDYNSDECHVPETKLNTKLVTNKSSSVSHVLGGTKNTNHVNVLRGLKDITNTSVVVQQSKKKAKVNESDTRDKIISTESPGVRYQPVRTSEKLPVTNVKRTPSTAIETSTSMINESEKCKSNGSRPNVIGNHTTKNDDIILEENPKQYNRNPTSTDEQNSQRQNQDVQLQSDKLTPSQNPLIPRQHESKITSSRIIQDKEDIQSQKPQSPSPHTLSQRQSQISSPKNQSPIPVQSPVTTPTSSQSSSQLSPMTSDPGSSCSTQSEKTIVKLLESLHEKLDAQMKRRRICTDDITLEMRDRVRTGYRLGLDEGLTWNVKLKIKYTSQDNKQMNEYIRKYTTGYYPKPEDASLIDGAMKSHFKTKKTEESRIRNNSKKKHNVQQANYERKSNKLTRRELALSEIKWKSPVKKRVKACLTLECMSSEEEDPDDCRALLVKQHVKDSTKWKECKKHLDLKAYTLLTDRSKKMLLERRVGRSTDKHRNLTAEQSWIEVPQEK